MDCTEWHLDVSQFRYYSNNSTEAPESLFDLAASLVGAGLVQIEELFPHLQPEEVR